MIIRFMLIGALLISGCSGSQARNTFSEGNQAKADFTGETVTLSIWAIEEKDSFLSQLVEAFEQENPEINVVISEIPAVEYTDRIEQSFKEDYGPDIAQIKTPHWLAAGHFLPLDAALEFYRVPFDDFNPGAITRDCIFEGRVFCLGSLTSGIIWVYNRDLFDLFGVPYPPDGAPVSFQDYHDLIIRLVQKSDRIEERIWGGDAGPYYNWVEPSTQISPDGRVLSGFINDEATSVSYQLLADAFQQGAVITPEEAEILQQDSLRLLINGKQATAMVDSSTAVPVLEQSGIRWGAAMVPTERTGDAPWSSNRTDGLGVLSGSQQPEAAIAFVIFLATHGSQLRLDRGEMPLSMPLAEQWAAGSEERRQVFEALKHGRPYPFIPGYQQTMSILWQAWDQITQESVSAKEALDVISVPMQETLDQTWEEFEAIQPADEPEKTPDVTGK